jgi:hypothetical protein
MTLDYRKNTPVDHARTTRQHAGEALKNGANAPALAGAAVAVIALTVGLFAVAAGHPGGGAIALIVAVVLGALSAVWLLRAHARPATPNCAGTPRIPSGPRRRPAAERAVFAARAAPCGGADDYRHHAGDGG